MTRHDPVTPALGQPVSRPGRRGTRPLIVLLSVLVAVALGVGVGALFSLRDGGSGGGAADGQTDQAVEAIEPAAVTSFDPVGGSGFEDDGNGTWSTQTYNTADFGNLKDGVGLLVDLGEAREVSTVSVDASAGLEMEVLGGDEPPSSDVSAFTAGESTTTGEAATTLSGADAGSHRYWLVWVTQLAASGGGFGAELGTPTVEGPPA